MYVGGRYIPLGNTRSLSPAGKDLALGHGHQLLDEPSPSKKDFPDWQAVQTGTKTYYWNTKTNEVTWDCPWAPPRSSKAKRVQVELAEPAATTTLTKKESTPTASQQASTRATSEVDQKSVVSLAFTDADAHLVSSTTIANDRSRELAQQRRDLSKRTAEALKKQKKAADKQAKLKLRSKYVATSRSSSACRRPTWSSRRSIS